MDSDEAEGVYGVRVKTLRHRPIGSGLVWTAEGWVTGASLLSEIERLKALCLRLEAVATAAIGQTRRTVEELARATSQTRRALDAALRLEARAGQLEREVARLRALQAEGGQKRD